MIFQQIYVRNWEKEVMLPQKKTLFHTPAHHGREKERRYLSFLKEGGMGLWL